MKRLVAGAEELGLRLDQGQLRTFSRFYEELSWWGRRANLTGITGLQQVETRHFLDSLTGVLALGMPPPEGTRVLDVGTGAGLPGIPLRTVWPGLGLTLLEATGKKARFLEHLRDSLGMPDVEVLSGRAEDLARDESHREAYDAVLARALAPMSTLAEITLPFARTGGKVVAYKKGDLDEEMGKAQYAIDLMGGCVETSIPVTVPPLDGDARCIVVLRKVRPTPSKFPRRPGIPGKRPLAAPPVGDH